MNFIINKIPTKSVGIVGIDPLSHISYRSRDHILSFLGPNILSFLILFFPISYHYPDPHFHFPTYASHAPPIRPLSHYLMFWQSHFPIYLIVFWTTPPTFPYLIIPHTVFPTFPYLIFFRTPYSHISYRFLNLFPQ